MGEWPCVWTRACPCVPGNGLGMTEMGAFCGWAFGAGVQECLLNITEG